MSQSSTFLILILSACIGLPAGCARAGPDSAAHSAPPRFIVRSDQSWISTGIFVTRGGKLLIEETGGAEPVLIDGRAKYAIGARGTYLFDVRARAQHRPYPLEPHRAHDDRRYPAYCLIGRIGATGDPFYVGSHFQGLAPEAGELWLGINDPAPERNRGKFRCRIVLDYPDAPLPKPPATESESQAAARAPAKHQPRTLHPKPKPPTDAKPSPNPIADANVVIFYIDGLRPDVAVEMAEWGHMPNFRELFLENGSWIRNSFTVQPSLTMIGFSSMITGVYANRHGVKMQSYYDWAAGKYVNGLDPRHFDRFAGHVEARGVKAIYDYFPETFASGAMPFEPIRANVLKMNLSEWVHRAVNTADYASNIRPQMDEVQTRFALDMASSRKVNVMLVWLPSTDVVSEHTPHGQFGGARATVARMDQYLGQIVERLKQRDRFEKTYFILTSDHGHAGGHEMVNERYDVKREVFHPYFQMNVMGVRHRLDFPGAPADRLGAVSDGDGAVGIFLPLGHVDSADHSAPNNYDQLAQYGLADGSKVNAVELFAEFTSKGRWPLGDPAHGSPDRPVDFAVAKVNSATVLLHTTNERQALIHTRRNAEGVFEYKYEPVRRFTTDAPPQPITTGDPLGYLDDAEFRRAVGDVPRWLAAYHTGAEWLRATYKTDYPGCVDTIALYFRWDGPASEKSPAPLQPSILLFSNRGWVFESAISLDNRHENTIGSRHGMAFREATNNCLFISGPGIRKNTIIETPHRMVDIMPTVLEMMGQDASLAGMDGTPIREIWEND